MEDNSKFAAPKPQSVAVIKTLTEAIDFIKEKTDFDPDLTVFRGHERKSWDFCPSLFRQNLNVRENESNIIRELIALYPHEFSNDHSMFDKLVRMQHFDLPTRLLDVSTDPLSALFFALRDIGNDDADGELIVIKIPQDRKKYFDSDAVSCISNLSNLSNSERKVIENTSASTISDLIKINAVDRLIQFIRVEKPHFQPRIKKEDLFKPYYVVPKMSNPRIISQRGGFIIFGLNFNNGPKYKKGISALSATIPASAKPNLRSELHKIGYREDFMFPEIQSASREIVKRFS